MENQARPVILNAVKDLKKLASDAIEGRNNGAEGST
jgi:hypothetical protein